MEETKARPTLSNPTDDELKLVGIAAHLSLIERGLIGYVLNNALHPITAGISELEHFIPANKEAHSILRDTRNSAEKIRRAVIALTATCWREMLGDEDCRCEACRARLAASRR